MKLPTKPSLFILLLFAFFTNTATAQKLELSVNANSGLFNYTGSGATGVIPYYAQISNNYSPITAYSTKATLSYGANVQGQYVLKSGFIAGLQIGYDFLRSKNDIGGGTYITTYPDLNTLLATYFFLQNGNVTTTNQFINLGPYVGYRVINKQTASLDLIAGADIGFGIKSKQTIKGTEPYPFNASGTTTNPPTDYRLKAGFVINVEKFALNFTYAHGLTNYIKDSENLKANSQVIRLGIGYQIL